jgi:hypothetical protein
MGRFGGVVLVLLVIGAACVWYFLRKDSPSVDVDERDVIAVDPAWAPSVLVTVSPTPSFFVRPHAAGLFRGDPGPCFKHSGYDNSTQSTLALGSWFFSEPTVCGPNSSASATREFRLDSPLCSLKRYSGEEVRRCFANKTILMLGDSVVRFQSVNLIVLLETLLPAIPCGESSQFNAKFHHPGYGRYCWGTIRCDNIMRPAKYAKDNFYFSNPDLGVNLTYLGYADSMFARYPLGWWPDDVKYVDSPMAWEFAYLSEVAPIIKAELGQFDLVVMNSGLWINAKFKENVTVAEDEMRAVEQLVKPGGPKPLWMTTTVGFLGRKDLEIGTRAAHEFGWPILDRKSMIQRLLDTLNETGVDIRHGGYVDNMHFTGFPYQEMNNALYNLLCGS